MAKAPNDLPVDETHIPFRITDTSESTKIDKSGRLVKFKVLHGQTDWGDAFTIELPSDGFSAKAALLAVANHVDELAQLHW